MFRLKKLIITGVILLPLVLGLDYLHKIINLVSFLPTPLRMVLPLFSRYTFLSLKDALHRQAYAKYPAYLFPVQGRYVSIQFNPKTNTQLELDTSEGGGYVCCEAPTFYVWVDKTDNIFWIKTHQADLISSESHWYGPFKLESSN